MRKWLLLVLLGGLVGCGGVGALSSNARAAVLLESASMPDMELIVTPLSTGPGDIRACDATSDGFGCNRDFRTDQAEYRFDTSSDSSTNPFYVYVKNTSKTSVRYNVIILMDEEEKVNFTDTVPAETTIRVARVFRTTADDL